MEAAINEALMVARAKNIQLTYDDPTAHTKEVCKATAKNKSSMLQDILHKKRTEIDMINGAVVKEAQKLSIQTPVNFVLSNIIKVMEQRHLS